jgi:hypothetical protein
MNATPPQLPPHDVAALQNTDPQWFKAFTKCGLEIVVVHLLITPGSPALAHPQVERALGLALQQAELGHYDSSHYPGCLNLSQSGYVWHFLHAHDLGKAMACLKAELEKRGLLDVANILHGEAHDQFRIWWSHDPEAIGKLVQPDAE